MDKEEILEKSRAENKNKDVYEREVEKQANTYTTGIMAILAMLYYALQIFAGKGINWGMLAIILSATMISSWVKYSKFHRSIDLFMAIIYTIIVLLLSGFHIYNQFASFTI